MNENFLTGPSVRAAPAPAWGHRRRVRGYDHGPMALLITFVLVTALTAGAIGAVVASGSTIGVILALFLHLIGTVAILGVTFGALGADGAD